MGKWGCICVQVKVNTGMPWFGYRYVFCNAFSFITVIISVITVYPLNLLNKGVVPRYFSCEKWFIITSTKNLSILAAHQSPTYYYFF